MGLLDNMSVMLGGLVTRAVGSSLFDWIRAVSKAIDQSTDGLSQAAWFIDPISGNDNNTGLTASTALKTDAERQRRWGNFARINQPITVTYLSSPGASDPVNFDAQIGLNSSLQIVGTKQVIPISGAPTAALTAVTVLNRGTQTPWDVTAVGLGAAHVGKIIRITAGPRINNYAVVMKDLGAGKVRVTPFGNLLISTTFVPFTETPAQAGDVVEVFDMPQIDVGTCNFRSGSGQAMTPTPAAIVLFDTIKPYCGTVDTASIHSMNVAVYFARSILRNCLLSGPGAFLLAGGLLLEGLVVDATSGTFVGYSLGAKDCSFCDFAGSNFAFGGFFGCTCVLEGDCLFQNSFVTICGMVQGGRVSLFDQATADGSFVVLPGQTYVSAAFFGSPDLLWGTANTGHAVVVRTGGTLAYTNKPTANSGLGAGREALIGGTDKVWGAVPYAEAVNFSTIAPFV